MRFNLNIEEVSYKNIESLLTEFDATRESHRHK